MKDPFIQSLAALQPMTSHQARIRFGGKASGLLEAFKLDIPIPETWLISIEEFETFVNLNTEPVAYIEKKLGSEIPDGLYAVRSSAQAEDSAEHSFAGIFETDLFVTRKNLAQAIARVWKSCHSLRVSAYTHEPLTLSMGVIIQPMIEVKYAGVAFSKHPSPANVFENHHIVIECAPTHGEKIVQGEITPWRFSGTEESICSATDAPWIPELIQALMKLKEFHHHEVDIEFIVNKQDELIVVQQRPISRAHPSTLLDLTHYVKKYKRELFSLDIEMLITGCARYLSSYLELPYQMERWMVMVTSVDGAKELWAHQLLDHAVSHHLQEHISNDPSFLDKIEMKYRAHVDTILHTDYTPFFDPRTALETRFFNWTEFLTPLHAHYYVPMFMIDALHGILLRKIPEEDLFFLVTYGIKSMMELLQEELQTFDGDQNTLAKLVKKYGFLKCHQVYETGYTAEELINLKMPKKAPTPNLEEKWKALLDTHINTPEKMFLFEKLREWMRIRNQDMEFLMFTILETRPLLEEIASYLGVEVKEIWNSSTALISHALQKKNEKILHNFSPENLVIYHAFGKTRLTNHLKVILESGKERALKGKKVFGEGVLEGQVVVAFSPKEIKEKGSLSKSTILVTGMTTPDFIPHLQHIAALVTDEGGILCHAAIVAREMGIPCLVGCGSATDLLKGGMRVRIDFDTGAIEKL